MPAIKPANVQFQHLKIILVERKVVLCFKCNKEENRRRAEDKKEDLSEEKERQSVVGASDDAELIIHYTSRGFHEYQKIWSPPNF